MKNISALWTLEIMPTLSTTKLTRILEQLQHLTPIPFYMAAQMEKWDLLTAETASLCGVAPSTIKDKCTIFAGWAI